MTYAPTRGGTAAAGWDSLLQQLDGHFLQSTPWQRVQQALGYHVVWDRGDGWMWSGAVRSGRFPRYLYVPYGPAAQPEAADLALQNALEATRSLALDFARIEPMGADFGDALARTGALATRSIQPRWTSVLDIGADEDALRRGLSAGHRGSINAAQRRGVRIRSSTDPQHLKFFLDLRERSRRRGGYAGPTAQYLRTVAAVLMPLVTATLYVADHSDAPIAAALCFYFGGTRYYAHAVSDPDQGRRLGAAAPLVWRMILDARARGLTRFDFWGVVPGGDSRHPWAGLSQFKLAFGGQLVSRSGTWDVPVRPLRHRLYRALHSLRR